jgi:hypothetical protein
MAESSNSTPLDIEQLNALAVRLRDASDSIRNPAAQKKLAGCSALPHLRPVRLRLSPSWGEAGNDPT